MLSMSSWRSDVVKKRKWINFVSNSILNVFSFWSSYSFQICNSTLFLNTRRCADDRHNLRTKFIASDQHYDQAITHLNLLNLENKAVEFEIDELSSNIRHLLCESFRKASVKKWLYLVKSVILVLRIESIFEHLVVICSRYFTSNW